MIDIFTLTLKVGVSISPWGTKNDFETFKMFNRSHSVRSFFGMVIKKTYEVIFFLTKSVTSMHN